jgi:hypothetical protein
LPSVQAVMSSSAEGICAERTAIVATKTIAPTPELIRRGEELIKRLEALLPKVAEETAKLEKTLRKGAKGGAS